MTIGTNDVVLLTADRISVDSCGGRVVRKRLNMCNHVVDGLLIDQRCHHADHLCAVHVTFVSAPQSLLVIHDLALQVPLALPSDFRRIHCSNAFALLPVACRAHAVLRSPDRRITCDLAVELTVGGLVSEPGIVVVGIVDDDSTAHRVMTYAAEFLAENFEATGLGRRQPQKSVRARHEIHLDAKLCNGEIVQHVFRTQQELDWLVDGNMDFTAIDQNVVLTIRVFGIHAERVVIRYALGVNLAELAVFARHPECPVPLLTYCLDNVCILRNVDEIGPDKQSGRQHRGHPDRCKAGQPTLEGLVFGLISRPRAFLVSEFNNAVRHEQIDRDKYEAGHVKSDVDSEVHHAPVGSQLGEGPGT